MYTPKVKLEFKRAPHQRRVRVELTPGQLNIQVHQIHLNCSWKKIGTGHVEIGL